MKKRVIEVPITDFIHGMWFDSGNVIADMEHYCGTQHAYMDRTTEKITKIERMVTKDAYEVTISPQEKEEVG